MEQLRSECLEAERNFPRREIRNFGQSQRLVRAINEIYFQESDDIEKSIDEIAAIKMIKQKQQLVRWNCKLQEHGFRDCNYTEGNPT